MLISGELSVRSQRIFRAATEMLAEAERALSKHGPENTMDGPNKTDGDRLAILVEEVGEVAKELTYDHATDGQVERLRKELVQVGAMAATWIAYIDEQKGY